MTEGSIRTVRVRALAELGRRLGSPHDRALADMAEAIDLATQDRHDCKRALVGPPQTPPGAERPLPFRYLNPTGALAASLGFGAETLAHLGYADAAGRPDVVMSAVFTMQLGPHTIWGNAETGRFVDVSNPWRVYR
ncbi:hypothetical protein [Prosthecomicrobium hirschii]|uniref:hypothetical protein n=1 Tax=Prosthecodimorpha hirschii TaxID=665126 RepID=UPI0022211121|nr:hypothetical protein [Prosthecomicrobium hirschii]MCW1839277.1 hypothetical protein [Prosthecomicrobium hirschii]